MFFVCRAFEDFRWMSHIFVVIKDEKNCLMLFRSAICLPPSIQVSLDWRVMFEELCRAHDADSIS